MLNELLLILIFIVLFIAREYFHSKEIDRLQPKEVKKRVQANQVMKEEENEIAVNDPEFDIKKINKVLINGVESPVTII